MNLFQRIATFFKPMEPATRTIHHVIASEFATDSDLRAYRHAKQLGWPDSKAFGVGDNCIGCYGDQTNGTKPMCALPPEDMMETWGSILNAKHKPVKVRNGDIMVVCIIADRMPHRDAITNGAGIDLNPAARIALNLPVGAMKPVTWEAI